MSVVSTTNPQKENPFSFQCPSLTASNYTTWAIKMEAILDAQGVWEAIEPSAGVAVDEKKSKMARAYIFQAIPEEILLQVAKKKTAKEVWDSLKTRFVGAERVQKARLHTLKSEFEALRMKEGETIDEYAGKLSGMISKYNGVGAVLGDEELVRKLLDTVTDKFIHLVASMEQYSEVEKMPFEEAIGRLKAYEDRVKLRQGGSSMENSLLFSKVEGSSSNKGNFKQNPGRGRGFNNERGGKNGSRGRGSSRGRGGRGGSGSSHESGGWNQKPRDKKNIRCFNCQALGHYASECKSERKTEQEVHLTKEKEEESTLLLSVCGEEDQSMVLLNEGKVFPKSFEDGKEGDLDVWYMDNGASNHMTGRMEVFAYLDQNVKGSVRFGDDSKVNIKGKGTILFKCKTGDQLIVENVYYIPALTSNILSLGQMTEVGYDIWMKNNFLKVYDEQERLVMKVVRSANRLYKIMLTIAKPACLKTCLEEESWVWHARLGHVNFQVLEMMGRKGYVEGMPALSHPKQVCEGCLVGKQTRQSFPIEAQWRASSPLELVHADICGPITPVSNGGNRYFMLIVDDFSRYMWVYMIKTKDEAFNCFKSFKSRVEKETKYKVRMLRTDRGGEFNSFVFKKYCEDAGIRRQTTAPYTPQQNGVVERRNRTVMEMTRSMLKSMKVPETLWGEAVRHTVYVLNMLPTKGVKGLTPYEAWKKRKPTVQYLKVFGCIAHVKRITGHLSKLDDRSRAMVYVGKEPGSKAFRLFNPKENKIVVSRDVIFEEKRNWEWVEKMTSHGSLWTTLVHNTEDGTPHIYGGANEEEILSPQYSNNSFTSFHENAGESTMPFGSSQDNTTSQSSKNSKSHISCSSSQSRSGVSTCGENRKHVTVPFEDESPLKGFKSVEEIHEHTTAMDDKLVHDIYVKEGELFLVDEEPLSYVEAATDVKWLDAMQTELEAIKRNNTWTLTQLPKNQKAIGLKWVFKLKKDANGEVTKHKARLVAKGYVQLKGVDYEEVFAPVARIETVRLILAMAATNNWRVHHLDVKTAFLNGELQEEVYVTQPDGFEVKGKEAYVYKLHKALYGLKQAPRAWNSKLDKTLKGLGFTKCIHEAGVYVIKRSGSVLILCVYVDDILLTGTRENDIQSFKERMKTHFEMSDMGLLSYYLGIENRRGICIKQAAYARKVLKLAGMENCNPSQFPMEHKLQLTKDDDGKPVDPTFYRQLIGSLRYLVHTRPDLGYSVGVVSRFMENPKETHLAAVKHILRYIKGTIYNGLIYEAGGDAKLVGYSDSSFGCDKEDGRSTTGTIFYYSGNVITWTSQKQRTVALSSCQAEYMAATEAACQALWLRNLLSEITGEQPPCVELRVDNEGAIGLSKNPTFHKRSRHIDTKYHFIRECVERGQIIVKHVDGKLQKADILTKSLPRTKFIEMKILIGVKDCPHQGESVG
ncbi:hypothetical protein SSX86_004606 [Deinandra increscens subsp. villosa]|uniref:Polyprotein n=1 Tax=Deinandra increscens subsp. villosa TaxID=3103831 RepID=A0AAP0H632_9ASTR